MPDTCDRCHRPKAATVAEYNSSGWVEAAHMLLDEPRGNPRGMCGANLPLVRGTWNSGHRDAAYESCRSERNVWQRDEIARLNALAAELKAENCKLRAALDDPTRR